jgi:predicted ATPase
VSIKAIRLRNFRGFRNAEIDLNPLTVLLGPNSAGKSSFGHALAAMAHCQWSQGGSEKASLTPGDLIEAEKWPVDLGRLEDLRTHGVSNERVYVELMTDDGVVDYGFGLEPPPPKDSPFSMGDLVLSYVSLPGRMHPGTQISTQEQSKIDVRSPAAASGSTAVGLTNVSIPPDRITLARRKEIVWWDEHANEEARVGIAGLVLETMSHSRGGTPAIFSGQARDTIRELLKGLTYLRATRERPSRYYPNGQRQSRRQLIGYGGEWTASVLNDLGATKTVRYAKLADVPRSPDEAVEISNGWTDKEEPLAEAVANWLKYLCLADSVETVLSPDRSQVEVRITVAGLPHNVTEVGFGISQILPVLTAGLLQPPDSLLIVDLPEAHLHPGPQVDLADFFCSLALSGRKCLVETHSEMFFHRLRLRAEMHPELRDKIAVYFVDEPKDGKCFQPHQVGLKFEEETTWPNGFFQEGWKTEVMINSLRRARRKNTIKEIAQR